MRTIKRKDGKKIKHTILVTGGATGIGFALARRFIKDGHTVISCGRREDILARAASQLPGLVTRRCDVTSENERKKMVAWPKRWFPGLNILVNNAGVQYPIDFSSGRPDPRDIVSEIDTNLSAPILLTAALLPHLRKQRKSVIINVSSGLAFCPIASIPVYCATKAALHSFTLSLRRQLCDSRIRVVEFIPPMVASELHGVGEEESGDWPGIISAEEFAEEAIRQFEAGEDEIPVGGAEGLRSRGEAMFDFIN